MGRARITLHNVRGEHWALFAGFLGTMATQIIALDDSWAHALSPKFLGTLLLQLSLFIGALFTPRIHTRRDTQQDSSHDPRPPY